MSNMTPRVFAEGLADTIMNMLCTTCYIKADGTVIGHRGHGGMWNAWECDRDSYIDSDTSAEFTRSTWIFPGEGEYFCPYLNRYTKGMYEWICDEDTGEELEDFDDVAARFQVSVVTSADTCTLYLGIDNQLDRNRLVFTKVIDLKTTHLSDELIGTIVNEADAAVTNFNG